MAAMRNHVLRPTLLGAVFAIACAAPAVAQPAGWNTDAFLCRDLALEPPLRVEACARALKAPSLSANVQVGLLSQRALAYDELGDYQRAVQDYDAAIVLTPNDPSLYLNRGVARIRGGAPAAAIPDYDQAIRLKPDWHLPYFDRAVALSDLGQRAAALADYQRALERKPDDPWIYVGLGEVHASGGDDVAAIAAYDQALKLRPDLDQAHMRRAKSLLRLDRPQEAIAAMDRALAALDPAKTAGKPEWWRLRAAARFQAADFPGAANDLTAARDLAPQDAAILRDLSRAQLAAGDIKAAAAAAVEALRIAGNDAANLLAAGQTALADGRRADAEALARRAVALKPGDAAAQTLLALSLPPGKEASQAAQAAADFAPQDAELQAVAAFLGAEPPGPMPQPAAATPAHLLLAGCIAGLQGQDPAAAAAAGARWSLCHLAALRGR